MISLEQACSDTERAVESALKAAKELSKPARALKKAAERGNIAAIRRAQSKLADSLRSLQQEIENAASSWPFTDEEVGQYLRERFTSELQNTAASAGLKVYERDGNLISYPSLVRVLPGEKAVRVDRKKNSDIRPSYLAKSLLKNQTKKSSFSSVQFLESLYTVYCGILSEEESDRLEKGDGVVKPLKKIYNLLIALPGVRREYDRIDFARDIYLLDDAGPRRTKDDATVSFHASTATRQRSSDLFTFVGPQGQSFTYYGIRFSKDT